MIQPMPPYPENVKMRKGALVWIAPRPSPVQKPPTSFLEGLFLPQLPAPSTTTVQHIVPFQFNPESVQRSLTGGAEAEAPGGQYSPVRFPAAPKETISLEIQVDVIDELDAGDETAAEQGVYPRLAALELMLYPPSWQVDDYQAGLAGGSIEIIPDQPPRTLFVWAPDRVLPVQVTSLSITEDLFDANLHPIRAQVQLQLRVLSYSDLFADDPDYSLFMTYQKLLERLAGWS